MRLFSFPLLLTCLFLISTSFAANQSVETFIQAQPKIRVLTDGGAGFGNQTASLNVINRLRQMGYKGSFEFIYPERAAYKIKTLFDLPENIPDDYFAEKLNIRFLKLKEYVNQVNQNRIEPILLGISGSASISFCEEAKLEGAFPLWPSLACKNLATVTKTKKFIHLSPFTEAPEDRDWLSKFDTEIFTQHIIKSNIQLGSDSKFIVMPVASLQETKSYLKNDNRGQELLIKKPGLQTLIDGIENQNFNVLPVYGYTVQPSGSCDAADSEKECSFKALTNILQIIFGARYAQNNGVSELNKPLIISVFYDFTKEANILQKLITEDWPSKQPDVLIAKKFITKNRLFNNFMIANLSDPASIKQIQNLKHGQILLLSMGSLPKIVFDGLYTHTGNNIWPQIREGANSFNSLILTGKPHFRCGGWEIGFSLVRDNNLKTKLENFYNNFCSNLDDWGIPDAWKNDGEIITQLGELILDSKVENSPLSQYFSFLKQEALKPENDRIHYALEAVIN